MGYRGKIAERQRARELRAQAWKLADIADELGVSKASVSVWVRDVEFTPSPRRGARRRGPNALQRRKQAEIAAADEAGARRLRALTQQEFLIAGLALYAGEGTKGDGRVALANTDPKILGFFCRWLRTFFDIDETRVRVALYLHEGLDLDAAMALWSEVTGVPPEQFSKPYRAVAKGGIRSSKHPYGCATVRYSCSRTHRQVMGLMRALFPPATDETA